MNLASKSREFLSISNRSRKSEKNTNICPKVTENYPKDADSNVIDPGIQVQLIENSDIIPDDMSAYFSELISNLILCSLNMQTSQYLPI